MFICFEFCFNELKYMNTLTVLWLTYNSDCEALF